MARIRTIKPDFFRHLGLFRLEVESGLPVRVAFAGLWTSSDRDGRFKWIPEELKLDCLPYDVVDFSRVLDALATRGHIVKYTVNGADFGFIPSWHEHQVINNRETASSLPAPTETSIAAATCTRQPRVPHASSTPLVHAQGEGKGREGKGKEGNVPPTPDGESAAPPATPAAKAIARTAATWTAYADAYRLRYQAEPVRNRTVNGQIAQFVDRLSAEEAPLVAAFYVGHPGSLYTAAMHPVNLLLRDAEKLRTEWATGRKVNGRAPAPTAQERNTAAKAARFDEMTGGRFKATPAQAVSRGETIDMEATDGAPRLLA
jgi:hypothetical protein